MKVKKENDRIKNERQIERKGTIKQEGPRQMSRKRNIRQVRWKKIVK